MAPHWRNSVEYKWNKSGHIRGDAMEPFLWSGGPFGGHQIRLWPKKAVFGRFGPFRGPSGAPRWPSLTCKTVPMHHRGWALTCSTLVSHCSTSLEPPASLMAQKGRFWPFWTLFGHISGQNGWNKSGAQWNKSILTLNEAENIIGCHRKPTSKKPPSLTHCDRSSSTVLSKPSPAAIFKAVLPSGVVSSMLALPLCKSSSQTSVWPL